MRRGAAKFEQKKHVQNKEKELEQQSSVLTMGATAGVRNNG